MTRNKKLVKMMALAVAASTVATSVPAYAAFDATYYAQQNPDVVAAIGTKPADLEMHYNVFGKKEGRAGSADEAGSALRQLFDAEYYAKLNPDVVAVYGNDANALFSHFLQFGIKEGRRINPYFDVNAYKKAYPDLVAAFGDDIAAYYNHFANHGIKEHRTLGGFPAEKIVPGGVAVASSGGSSSSSGGGGSSSKPAPKPADTTPAGQVTPTPDTKPTPDTTPTPTPDDGKQDESLPSEVEVAQTAIENATKKVEAELEKYDENNLPTSAEKAELVKATKAIVDSSRELADKTAEAASAAATELAAAQAKLLSLQGELASGSAKTASTDTANKITAAGTAEANLLQAQYNVEKAKADYDKAVKERKAAQDAYDSAMDVARDLIKNVFDVDPSTYESSRLTNRKDLTPEIEDDEEFEYDGVADKLKYWYQWSTGEDVNTKALGIRIASFLDGETHQTLLEGEDLETAKKGYVSTAVKNAKKEAVDALLKELLDSDNEPTNERAQAIYKALYVATATKFNEDGSVAEGGDLVKATKAENSDAIVYAFKAEEPYADAAAAIEAFKDDEFKGTVSGVDTDKVAADATSKIEKDLSDYEKCQKAYTNLMNPTGTGATAAEILESKKGTEATEEKDLSEANALLNGGTVKRTVDGQETTVVVEGAVKTRDDAVKAKNTAIVAREATYAAEGVDGSTLEALRAADAQAETVAADIVAKKQADIAADKAEKAKDVAEENWDTAKKLNTQEEDAQP